MNVTAMLGRLSPYRGNVQTATNRQQTKDIIREIEKCHYEYAKEYDKIADQFSRSSAKETAAALWWFLKTNVRYSVEPADRQSVKSPAAILASGKYKSGNDCKHYALFSGGILDALRRKGKKINFVYRFVNYRLLETDPQHVFIVVKDKGREIWIDPVLDGFNEKKPYINGIDKKINSGMPVYKISGIDDYEAQESYGMPTIGRKPRRTKEQKRAVRIERKEKRQVRRKEKGSFFSRTIVRGGLVVPRNAFLKLVALNVLNMAVKMNDKAKSPDVREKMRQKWLKLGGKPDVLFKNIARGVAVYKRKNPAYIGAPISPQFAQAVSAAAMEAQGLKGRRGVKLATKGAGIAAGAASALLAASNPATAGLIASAGAIIAAMSEFIGKEPKQALEAVAPTLAPEQRAEIATQSAEVKAMTSEAPSGTPVTARQASTTFDETPARPKPGQQADEEQQGPETSGASGGLNKNFIILGGVALAAVLLMRKK